MRPKERLKNEFFPLRKYLQQLHLFLYISVYTQEMPPQSIDACKHEEERRLLEQEERKQHLQQIREADEAALMQKLKENERLVEEERKVRDEQMAQELSTIQVLNIVFILTCVSSKFLYSIVFLQSFYTLVCFFKVFIPLYVSLLINCIFPLSHILLLDMGRIHFVWFLIIRSVLFMCHFVSPSRYLSFQPLLFYFDKTKHVCLAGSSLCALESFVFNSALGVPFQMTYSTSTVSHILHSMVFCQYISVF